MSQLFENRDRNVFEIIEHLPYVGVHQRNRGSYMSAHVLLNLLNELRKRDKM